MNPKWARVYLRVVQGAVVASAVLFGAMAWALTSSSTPVVEKALGAIFVGIIWAALHVGYLLAPRFYATPRRKLALWLIGLPAIVCVGTILFSINAVLADISINPQNQGLLPLMLLYAAAGAAVYIVPFFVMLTGRPPSEG